MMSHLTSQSLFYNNVANAASELLNAVLTEENTDRLYRYISTPLDQKTLFLPVGKYHSLGYLVF